MNKNLRISSGVILFIVIAVFFWFTNQKEEMEPGILLETIKKTDQNILSGIESQSRELIKKGKIKEAIELVVLAFQKKYIDNGKCHALLHTIGHLAYSYNKNDIKFLSSFIDKRCNAAYMHGMEAEIFLQNKEFVPIIHNLCELALQRDSSINCYHGVGHAALGLGNTALSYNVTLALGQCNKLANGPQMSLSNCYGGVFSEYGNLASNYDTDTGLHYSGSQRVTIPYEHTLEFCRTFDSIYQDDCSRQLVKITYQYKNPTASFQECVYKGYEFPIQFICVRSSAERYATHEMFIKGGESLKAPPLIFSYTPMLRRAFIEGVIAANKVLTDNSIPQKLGTFCLSFPDEEDKNYCISLDHN